MLGDDGKEDPSSKIQAPEKRQTPRHQDPNGSSRRILGIVAWIFSGSWSAWILVLLWILNLGTWSLGFVLGIRVQF
jgi:hypothetical protein